jgi:heme oxygenase
MKRSHPNCFKESRKEHYNKLLSNIQIFLNEVDKDLKENKLEGEKITSNSALARATGVTSDHCHNRPDCGVCATPYIQCLRSPNLVGVESL